jgi:SAM-dependent methyltransferase
VICTASIEYLARPLAVMAEITRVLRPKGILTIAFSNRWFPPKVIKIWPELHEFERLGLVIDMLLASGGFEQMATLSRRWLPRPVDDSHQELIYSDPPLYGMGKQDINGQTPAEAAIIQGAKGCTSWNADKG